MPDEQQQQELTAKEAVKRAVQEVQDLYEGTMLADLVLEEIEQSNNVWLVTLSFERPGRGTGLGTGLGAALVGSPREYKRVRIDAHTGTFKGMEIRTLPTPTAAPEHTPY